ncbi:MAG: NCAIR mutase (PurE)-related protein [Myxococcota bacterium]|jgi:NCAIR mutase (PurE)-related protein
MLPAVDRATLTRLLQDVRAGSVDVDAALNTLKDFPVAELDQATIDTHRTLRRGFPEVILSDGKTDGQMVAILQRMLTMDNNIMATRISAERSQRVLEQLPGSDGEINALGNLLLFRRKPVEPRGRGMVAVITAGTSDSGVAEEAAVTCELMGNEVRRVHDVGVAGIHRLLKHLPTLREARVVIVAAGMEGALASVVGGLVECPVIAVPTSVGYGASFGGLAALLGMLNACAAGITVVNIDNGFGAGYAAALMNRRHDP